jgi:hypothetical protein
VASTIHQSLPISALSSSPSSPLPSSLIDTLAQGLPLVHFSAQHKDCLGVVLGGFRDKTAQVELSSGRGAWGVRSSFFSSRTHFLWDVLGGFGDETGSG